MDWTTALIAAASEARLRSGFGGATTSYPEVTSSRLMPGQPDASANAPWTRTEAGLGECVTRTLLVTRFGPALTRRPAAGLSPVQVIAPALARWCRASARVPRRTLAQAPIRVTATQVATASPVPARASRKKWLPVATTTSVVISG